METQLEYAVKKLAHRHFDAEKDMNNMEKIKEILIKETGLYKYPFIALEQAGKLPNKSVSELLSNADIIEMWLKGKIV
ncbi:MAG: hypothetical protein JWQ09_5900 [Segetibacter sp.]|nr:hypothetical protein [Segetibacter sp.]